MEKSSFKQIFRFFLGLLMIVSVVFVFDQGIGRILKYFYFRQEYGERSRITYAIDSTFADVLIFGSSRAVNGYVPEIIEDRLHYTCYNAGRYGSDILYNYTIYKIITHRYSPKLIIFDISPEEVGYTTVEYERLSVLLPYYQKYSEVRNIVDMRGPLEKIKHSSSIYFYNSLILQIVAGNLEYDNRIALDIKGHIPLAKRMKNESLDTSRITTCILDENKIRVLKDIISSCQQNDIDLVFVYSPIWNVILDSYYKNVISKLFSENGISFFDMSNHSTFITNPKYFADKIHLNIEGAKVFSTILTDKILQTK